MNRFKKTACLILTVLCLFASAFSAFASDADDFSYGELMSNVISTFAQNIMTVSDHDELQALIDYSKNDGDELSAGIYQNWLDIVDITGTGLETGDIITGQNEDGTYFAEANVKCEHRVVNVKMVVTEGFDDIKSITFEYEKTFGEKMKNAFLNLILGMGTVFAVLIFLMFVIGLFKYVPGLADKFAGKKDTKAAPAAAPAVSAAPAAEEVVLQDDGELVAVIAAAIAAYEGTSADGLVVRSIRRVGKSNWKR